jgi:hypothetical protein
MHIQDERITPASLRIQWADQNAFQLQPIAGSIANYFLFGKAHAGQPLIADGDTARCRLPASYYIHLTGYSPLLMPIFSVRGSTHDFCGATDKRSKNKDQSHGPDQSTDFFRIQSNRSLFYRFSLTLNHLIGMNIETSS